MKGKSLWILPSVLRLILLSASVSLLVRAKASEPASGYRRIATITGPGIAPRGNGAPTVIPRAISTGAVVVALERDNKRGSLLVQHNTYPMVLLERLGTPHRNEPTVLTPVPANLILPHISDKEARMSSREGTRALDGPDFCLSGCAAPAAAQALARVIRTRACDLLLEKGVHQEGICALNPEHPAFVDALVTTCTFHVEAKWWIEHQKDAVERLGQHISHLVGHRETSRQAYADLQGDAS